MRSRVHRGIMAVFQNIPTITVKKMSYALAHISHRPLRLFPFIIQPPPVAAPQWQTVVKTRPLHITNQEFKYLNIFPSLTMVLLRICLVVSLLNQSLRTRHPSGVNSSLLSPLRKRIMWMIIYLPQL